MDVEIIGLKDTDCLHNLKVSPHTLLHYEKGKMYLCNAEIWRYHHLSNQGVKLSCPRGDTPRCHVLAAETQ